MKQSFILSKWAPLINKFKHKNALHSQYDEQLIAIQNSLQIEMETFFKHKVQLLYLFTRNINLFKHNFLSNNSDIPSYQFITDSKQFFGSYYLIIKRFMLEIKKEKRILLSIIKDCNSDDIESILDFICNLCFEDPFDSMKSVEDLLEIFTLFLVDEVNDLSHPKVMAFLDNKSASYLFKGLSRRCDIKDYLNRCLQDIILDMDNMSEASIALEPSYIINIINQNRSASSRKFSVKTKPISNIEINNITSKISMSSLKSNNNDIFHSPSDLLFQPKIINVDNYILNKEFIESDEAKSVYSENELNQRINDNSTTELMKQFYKKQLSYLHTQNVCFTNNKIIENLQRYSIDLSEKYCKNLEKIKFFIDKLMYNFNQNLVSVPYSIKCISKVIDILIQRKFPNISEIERFTFISEFIIGKLIIPILTNPDYNGIINHTIISFETRKDLFYLSKIIKKIFRATFFNEQLETALTPLNSYIVEIFPYIHEFLTNIINVNLPESINNIIYNKKSDSISNVNNKQLFSHDAICFTYIEFKAIINFFRDNENSLSNILQNTNLINYYNEINNSFDDIKNIFLQKISDIKYFFIINTDFSFQCNFALTSMTNEISTTKFCIQKVLANIKEEELKVNQHILCSSKTEEFFHNISRIIQLEEYPNNINSDQVPIGWYCALLEINLNKLNDDYKKDEYNKLITELINDVNQNIFNLQNNSDLTKLELYLSKCRTNNNTMLNEISKIDQIKKIYELFCFINNASIICYIYKDKNDIYHISKETDNNAIECKSIKDFILECQSISDIKIDIKTNRPTKVATPLIWEYIDFVNNSLYSYVNSHPSLVVLKQVLHHQEEVIALLDVIEEFIIEKMYFNIYKGIPNDKDNALYQKCLKLANLNYKDLGIKDIYINEVSGKLWLIGCTYMNQLEIEKTPIKKLKCLELLFKIINNSITFSTGKTDSGIDDIFPMFIYIIIQSKPKRFISECNFISSMINPKKLYGNYGFLMIQAESAIEYINNYNI